MKVSIYDIAKEVGLSGASVSLALNNKKGISEETRKRIQKVAKELGYIPNNEAKSLTTKTSTNIVLYMSSIDYEYFHGSFNFDILKFISLSLNLYSYRTIIQISTLEQDAEVINRIAKSETVGVFVFIGTRLSSDLIFDLVGDVPCIFFNKPQIDVKNGYSVSFDNRKATTLLTDHLINLGHKDIAFVGYLPGVVTTESRLLGYKDSHEKNKIKVNDERIIHTEHLPEYGYSVVKDIILKNKPLPSAFVCGNDRIASGVMKALLKYEFKIPQDVSVCGIDNSQLTDILKVPLTSINIHTDKIGTAIANMIIGVFNNSVDKKNVMIDVDLVKRDSTGVYNKYRRKMK